MPYWFAKKGQPYSVPLSTAIKANGRSYDSSYRYHKDGKTMFVITTIKNYYIDFPYHKALFFELSPMEIHLSGKPVEYMVEDFFKPD